jgi:hypothetical protein
MPKQERFRAIDAARACATMAAMSERSRPTPNLTETARAEADERRRRQAEALKANLARRKAQARLREEAGGQDPTPEPD